MQPACDMGIYTEVHIKCVLPSARRDGLVSTAAASGWHPSRNPFAVLADESVVQFVNRRFYGAVRVEEVDAAVDALVPLLTPIATIVEIKYEVAIYDTNELHDRWWMATSR